MYQNHHPNTPLDANFDTKLASSFLAFSGFHHAENKSSKVREGQKLQFLMGLASFQEIERFSTGPRGVSKMALDGWFLCSFSQNASTVDDYWPIVHSADDENCADCYRKSRNIKQDDNFYIENEQKTKHLISDDLLLGRNNNEGELDKIINISEPISSKIINEISKKNLKEYIPFKDLEANLLIDCSRYISDDAKYFNVILTCGIAMALNALKIKYSIGLISDYSFKIELKKINNEHRQDYFQMLLDCIFLPRLMTHYASCLNYAIDKFETKNKMIFFIISNAKVLIFLFH